MAASIRTRWAVGLVAALLVVAGCSEDRGEQATTTSTTTATQGTCDEDLFACAQASSIGDVMPDAPTTAGGEPLVIGMINQQNTALGSYPELASAAEAAAAFVNAELGGVGGRPVQIEVCNTEFSPEGSTACAQQLVQEGAPAVLGGIDVFGTGVDVLAENEVPYVGGIPVSAPSVTSPGSYQWSGGTWGATIAFAHHAATELGARSAAVVYPEFGPITQSAEYGATVLEDEGVEDVQLIPYPITATDVTSPLQAAAAAEPEALIVLAADTGCAAAFEGIATVGIEAQVYLVGACASPAILDQAGPDRTEGTIFNVEGPIDPEEAGEDAALYQAVAAQYGDGFDPVGAGTVTFRSFMNLYRVLATLDGEVTAAAIGAALAAQEDAPSFMGHPSTCDGQQLEGLPALCSPQQILVQQQDGALTQITGWIDVGAIYAGG